jgi:filamentous hemagglutinin family protein
MKIPFFTLVAASLFSLPQEPLLVSGTARFSESASALEIATSDRSILNWKEFSIGAGEKVIFRLPETSNSILNRVTGGNESAIFGELSCNGRLILINPSGVLFGPSASVDCFSLIATSLNVLDADFIDRSELRFFAENSQRIENLGTLRTGDDLYLIAPQVIDEGVCISNQGEVILASCAKAIIDSPDGKIKIVSDSLKLQDAGVLANGTIQARKASLLADGNLARLAINLTGIVEAGEIWIESIEGAAAIDGNLTSKEVRVDGKCIDLGPNARLDLSSDEEGGKCRIEAQEWLSVAKEARVDASSKQTGGGGSVILNSLGATHFQGTILSEAEIGDGGFVEVSGANLAFKGFVSTHSSSGKTGTLLLDPYDLTISAAASALVNGLPNGPFSPMVSACFPGPGHAILEDADLISALSMTNVMISTVGAMGTCPGDIIFDQTAVATYSSTNSLTLIADGSVIFDSSLINMDAGAISITSNGGNVNVIAIDTSISVETNGGPIDVTASSGDLNIQGGALVGNFARILAAGAQLDVTVSGDINLTGGNDNGAEATLRNTSAPLTIHQASNIVVTGGTHSGAPASIFSGSGGDLTITCQTMSLDTTASGASVSVSGDNDCVIDVTNGDLQILADAGGTAIVNASFEITATVSGNIVLTGNGGGYAAIFGDRESATIEATNGSITMNGLTQMYAGNLANQNLLVIAGTSIFANDNASFDIFSPTGTLTLVVDNLFPTSPGFGSGQFVLGPTALVNAMGNQLQIFTAYPTQNTIQGTLNGFAFAPGPDNERFDTYYPDAFFVSDYVVFYKTPIDSGFEQILVEILQPEFDDFAEMFRLLHPFSEYIYGAIRFTQAFQNPEVLMGMETYPDEFYFVRKKSSSGSWFEIDYNPAKF